MFNSTVLCALILLLSALMLHYLLVVEENFQVERNVSRRPGARARPRRGASQPPPPPPQAPAPAPTAPVAPACPSCPPCPAAVAAPVATVAAVAGPANATPVAPAVAPVSTPAPTTDAAKVDQTTGPAPARAPAQPSMPFSELVNSLIAYKPIQSAQQQVYGQPLNYKAALDGTAVNNIGNIPAQEIKRDVKRIRMGVKDIQNILKADRSEQRIPTRTPSANSDALQQGNWFRSNSDGGNPYAMGQQPGCSFRPVDDMNDYIRKDSIPCWGCTLK